MKTIRHVEEHYNSSTSIELGFPSINQSITGPFKVHSIVPCFVSKSGKAENKYRASRRVNTRRIQSTIVRTFSSHFPRECSFHEIRNLSWIHSLATPWISSSLSLSGSPTLRFVSLLNHDL